MSPTLRWLKIPTLLVAGLVAAYLLLLVFPEPLFAYKFASANLTLYCDDPIPPEGSDILADVQRRLDKCPLYTGRPHEDIFICDHAWHFDLLANRNRGSGGFAYGFAPFNVYLRRSDIARNILFRRDGTPSGMDRPLSYFIAHEITHNLTQRFLGAWAYWHLPVWKREGYADYVGKGGDFDFQKNLALFRAGDPSLNPRGSGLYLRYHLLVAELLDRRRMTVAAMLRTGIDRKKLEEDLRSGEDEVP
jgi:hypothetical protein